MTRLNASFKLFTNLLGEFPTPIATLTAFSMHFSMASTSDRWRNLVDHKNCTKAGGKVHFICWYFFRNVFTSGQSTKPKRRMPSCSRPRNLVLIFNTSSMGKYDFRWSSMLPLTWVNQGRCMLVLFAATFWIRKMSSFSRAISPSVPYTRFTAKFLTRNR